MMDFRVDDYVLVMLHEDGKDIVEEAVVMTVDRSLLVVSLVERDGELRSVHRDLVMFCCEFCGEATMERGEICLNCDCSQEELDDWLEATTKEYRWLLAAGVENVRGRKVA